MPISCHLPIPYYQIRFYHEGNQRLWLHRKRGLTKAYRLHCILVRVSCIISKGLHEALIRHVHHRRSHGSIHCWKKFVLQRDATLEEQCRWLHSLAGHQHRSCFHQCLSLTESTKSKPGDICSIPPLSLYKHRSQIRHFSLSLHTAGTVTYLCSLVGVNLAFSFQLRCDLC